MPTAATHRSDNGRTQKKAHAGTAALKELAASTLSTEMLLDLVERLGLKDLLVGRLRSRVEDIDLDALLDDALDYIRRNPEVAVVLLGALTVTTGMIVFLEQRRQSERSSEREEVEELPVVRAKRRRAS